MINLYLIRHGNCEGEGRYIGSGSDVSLVDSGKKQIELISDYLFSNRPRTGFDCFYSSPMLRAIESSEIISKKLDHSFERLAGLEEINFGDWEKKSYMDINRLDPEAYSEWIHHPILNSPPGGESLKDLEARVIDVWLKLNEKITLEKETSIILLSHRGPLIIILLNLLNLELKHFWNFKMDRGSISLIKIHPRFAELQFLNRTF